MRLAAATFALSMLGGVAASQAAVLYSNDFNSYVGGYQDSQYQTNLKVEAVGTVAGFTARGFGALHAVDRTGNGDWAVMLYAGDGTASQQPNGLLSSAITNANVAGTTYTVNFQDAGAVYTVASQATKQGDYFVVRVQDSSGKSLKDMSAGENFTSSNPFVQKSFTYVGTGSGSVFLNIFAVASAGDFSGAIDNISISDSSPAAVPEPASMALLGMGLLGAGMLRRRTQNQA